MSGKAENRYSLNDILTPQAMEALKHHELLARRRVEGMLHGAHRSRRKGVSTEFDHHKNYQPGDPLKHVDWKVSARNEDYVVKRYLEDTALSTYLVVDSSASMLQESGGPSIYLHAARLAASIAYLVLKQRDSVGLVLTSTDATSWIPPRPVHNHLVEIMQALAAGRPASRDNVQACLKMLLDRNERKGLITLISDLMFDPVEVQKQLGSLQAQGHEVLVLQLRDPAEETFPFRRWVQFQDRENPSVRHRLDTVPLRRIYREEYAALMDEWRRWARKYDIHFVSFSTSDRVETAVSEYLAFRSGLVEKR